MNLKKMQQVIEVLGIEGIAQLSSMNLEIEKNQIDKLEPMLIECLSFFDCKRCGDCCCDCSVQLSDEELMHLLKRDGNKVFDLLDENVIGNALKAPCGYLKNNACEIHDIKPFVCKIYPFTLKYLHFLAICLCPMGLEIKNELQSFLDEYKKHKKIKTLSSTEEQRYKQNIELLQEVSNKITDSVGYQRGRIIDQAYIPFITIPLFLRYLKSKKFIRK